MDKQNAYDASFKYEILNEVISGINGFAFRNYGNDAPPEIKQQLDEVHEIYCKISSEQNLGKLEEYDRRLSELRSYIFEHTPLPHKYLKCRCDVADEWADIRHRRYLANFIDYIIRFLVNDNST